MKSFFRYLFVFLAIVGVLMASAETVPAIWPIGNIAGAILFAGSIGIIYLLSQK